MPRRDAQGTLAAANSYTTPARWRQALASEELGIHAVSAHMVSPQATFSAALFRGPWPKRVAGEAADALAAHVRTVLELRADAVLVSLDGPSACDTMSRACPLRAAFFYGQPSALCWWDSEGNYRTVAQGEGLSEGNYRAVAQGEELR